MEGVINVIIQHTQKSYSQSHKNLQSFYINKIVGVYKIQEFEVSPFSITSPPTSSEGPPESKGTVGIDQLNIENQIFSD